ncbi:universal stress protein domain containing protein [Musa troglodytarum]|uniref:Universal stress protein domain containing protein n=1 Tax=Musa troglodytarum TaxID=320322 RepID=A0A9E7H6A9_9LILI|nr:universal stress protein domain containing protein [Musa troglodytarum]
MGRTGTRLPSFCLNRVATRIRVRSPPIESKPLSADEKLGANGGNQEMEQGRRIMIVVDSSPEAKAALLWALSHSVQSNDTVVLVQIVKPSRNVMAGERVQTERQPKGCELLHSMKSICQAKKPEVQVELRSVEGKERGPTIVEEAGKQGASLLVMGQRKRSTTWRLIMMWAGNKVGGGTVDYCVQNAACMALAVRRKSRRGGGYLITTKRHKDFWLLA